MNGERRWRSPARGVLAAAVLAGLLGDPCVRAQADATAERVQEVYLSKEAALRVIFAEGERIEEVSIRLHADEKARLIARLGRGVLLDDVFAVYRGLRADGSLSGYAVITDEKGKVQPITFIVGVTPSAAVKDVAVMIYRESRGGEVRRRRFLAQFVAKSTEDKIRRNADILNVSGATISVDSIARGVRRVLHTVDECLIGPRRRIDLMWHAASIAAADSKASGVEPRRQVHYVMGTTLEAVAYGEPGAVDRALGEAFAEVTRLDRLLSTFLPDSEISRVNRNAFVGPVRVSPETLECVDAALRASRLSGGAFDSTRASEGYAAVEIDRTLQTIRFRREGIRLDLGGIGKGYALDRAAAVLDSRGIHRALLDFGGQVLALDPPPGEPGWLVAVSDPASTEAALGGYEITRASVSTSATVERGSHILDPRTGKPPEGALSATSCARTATEADALSTILFVLGPEAGLALARTLDGCAAMIVPAGGGEPLRAEGPGAPNFVRFDPVVAGKTPSAGGD